MSRSDAQGGGPGRRRGRRARGWARERGTWLGAPWLRPGEGGGLGRAGTGRGESAWDGGEAQLPGSEEGVARVCRGDTSALGGERGSHGVCTSSAGESGGAPGTGRAGAGRTEARLGELGADPAGLSPPFVLPSASPLPRGGGARPLPKAFGRARPPNQASSCVWVNSSRTHTSSLSRGTPVQPGDRALPTLLLRVHLHPVRPPQPRPRGPAHLAASEAGPLGAIGRSAREPDAPGEDFARSDPGRSPAPGAVTWAPCGLLPP